jgi:hypothetical protein
MGAEFWDRGFVVADDLLDASQIALTRAAMQASDRNGQMRDAVRKDPVGSRNQYAPMAGGLLLRHCCPAVERIVERELVPSFAFWRIYGPGSQLVRHTDRPACEISVSVAVHSEPAEQVWPLWLEDVDGAAHAVALRPGAGLLYQGHKLPHWREPFTGEAAYQVFLFYVIKDGVFAEHAHDHKFLRRRSELK